MPVCVYRRKNHSMLIAPNKCGSSWIEQVASGTVISEDYAKKLVREDTEGSLKITAIKRDPVKWYWSGYFFVERNREIFPVQPTRWTPKQHWRLSLQRKTGIHQDPDSKFWDFDFHSWVDPWSQVYGEEYGFVPPDRTVTWVDIDSIAFRTTVASFSYTPALALKGPPVNVTDRSQKSGLSFTKEMEELIIELDDWSWRLGYDIRKSCKAFRENIVRWR